MTGRIAGTRTKMELAWQKERDSQKKLINELNTMARDLKSTLLVKKRYFKSCSKVSLGRYGLRFCTWVGFKGLVVESINLFLI